MRPNVGVIGLGAMGFNTALNMARNGFSVAGFDVDARKTAALGDRGPGMVGVASLDTLLEILDRPPWILLLAPAEHTESIIAQLAPRLDGADVLVDMYRTATLPANLVQAQRDFFGAHGFERIDAGGHIHRDWQAVKAGAL